jgi:hypothetical protein
MSSRDAEARIIAQAMLLREREPLLRSTFFKFLEIVKQYAKMMFFYDVMSR